MTTAAKRQRGFALMTALFVVVVLAVLATFMLRLSVLQQTTVSYALQGERAYYAARSGLEWGVSQALVTPASCTGAYPVINIGVYRVTVSCAMNGPGDGSGGAGEYTETASPYHVFRITAVAEYDAYGGADYIRREVESTVTDAP